MSNDILMVNEFLESLKLGDEQTFNNLSIVPLISSKPIKMKLKTLQEGLSDGTVEITEVNDNGNVPLLKFTNNNGDVAVLVMSGELIKGNMQDRTVKQSFLIYRKSSVSGDVFCCEAGRFKGRGQQGYKPDRNIAPSIRRTFSKTNQSRVWEQIRAKSERMGVHSETSAADDIYRQYQRQLAEYKRAFSLKPEHVGMIGLIKGKPIVMDASCVTDIFQKQFPALINGLVIDALDSGYCKEIASYRDMTAGDFLKSAIKVKKTAQDAVIGGTGYQFDEEGIVGGALVNHDVVVQFEAFAEA